MTTWTCGTCGKVAERLPALPGGNVCMGEPAGWFVVGLRAAGVKILDNGDPRLPPVQFRELPQGCQGFACSAPCAKMLFLRFVPLAHPAFVAAFTEPGAERLP